MGEPKRSSPARHLFYKFPLGMSIVEIKGQLPEKPRGDLPMGDIGLNKHAERQRKEGAIGKIITYDDF